MEKERAETVLKELAFETAEQIFETQWAFISGDASREELEPYRGRRVDGRLVETDPEVLIDIAQRGDADPDDLYRELF